MLLMGKRLKRISLWLRRSSHLPVFLIGAAIVVVLFLNEETSLRRSMEFQQEINRLNKEIKENRDSAAYYRARREAILRGEDDLEHIAREQYNMQRPTEDVYLIREEK